MIIKPMIRSNICINAHPIGCAKETERQINYAVAQKAKRNIKSVKEGGKGPATVLVLGCSTGYGLASRIAAAFEYGADTIGVSFEKEGTESRGGTPGWYNNMAFDKAAKKEGLVSITMNADAFSHETRAAVIEEIKKLGKTVDLVVYSLASPVRVDPDTKEMYKSVIKPIGKVYSGVSVDMMTGKLSQASTEPATEEEIQNTVKVMGGADWALWMDALAKADVLSKGVRTVAYSYIGPELSHAIYRDGTIGAAKKDLEATALKLNEKLSSTLGGVFLFLAYLEEKIFSAACSAVRPSNCSRLSRFLRVKVPFLASSSLIKMPHGMHFASATAYCWPIFFASGKTSTLMPLFLSWKAVF